MKSKVLVFCRPYLIPDFQENIDPLRDEFDFYFLTDGKKKGVADTRARFYSRLETAGRPEGFSEEDELNVVARCRLLRNLPRANALQMLRSMASVLCEEINKHRPNVVLSHVADEYVTHLLAELSRKKGIYYLGFFYSYFPKKVQFLQFAYGQAYETREPSNEEVKAVLEQISERTFRQNYLQKDTYSRWRHLKSILRYRIKKFVFYVKSRLEHDQLNLHYAILPYVAERRHWQDFPADHYFHKDWHVRLKDADDARPLIYFPLSYFPETTTDYWVKNRRIIDYEQVVLEICHALSCQFRIVVKEHLHMLGARKTTFYSSLLDLPGIVSVPPLEFSNDVAAIADVVLMGSGSVGIESFIRGKPIVTYCDTSFWFIPANAAYVDLGKLCDWPSVIADKIRIHTVPTQDQRLDFVRQCLRSTVRQERPGRIWPICVPSELRLALQAALPN